MQNSRGIVIYFRLNLELSKTDCPMISGTFRNHYVSLLSGVEIHNVHDANSLYPGNRFSEID